MLLAQPVRLAPAAAGASAATAAILVYLEDALRSVGYETRREPFQAPVSRWIRLAGPDGQDARARTAEVGWHENLVAERSGGREPERVLELGAHYDTVTFFPGADDNASGVAALLETARVLAGVPLDRAVRFCFYAMEEEGLSGSRAHVAGLGEQEIDGAIILDMVGFTCKEDDCQDAPLRIPLITWLPEVGDFLLVFGNFSSGGLGNRVEYAADLYVPELPYHSANRIGSLARTIHEHLLQTRQSQPGGVVRPSFRDGVHE